MAALGMLLPQNDLREAHYPTRWLGRHFVHVQCDVLRPGERIPIPWGFSAFVAEHQERWVLVTAGHCLGEIGERMDDGYQFLNWTLDDQVSADARHRFLTAPFLWNLTPHLACYDEPSGIDYAFLALPQMHRLQLEANGVIPLNRDCWATRRIRFGDFFLLGIPNQGVNPTEDGRVLLKEARAMHLEPLTPDRVPESMRQKAMPRHFFRITGGLDNFEPQISSIVGMSGGPVFAIRKLAGQLRYWVIGIQSTWDPATRIIAACPTSRLHIVLTNWFSQQAGTNASDAPCS